MHQQTFTSQTDFITAALSEVKKSISAAEETCFIALSGGQTPLPVYAALNPEDVTRAEFFLADERCMPLDDKDSNYRAIREVLPEEAILQPIDTALPPAEAALAYSQEIDVVPNSRFDLIILGLGQDGHTASLFPNDVTAHESLGTVIPTLNPSAPHPPVRERVTLTFNTILKAKKLLLLISGAEKAAAVEELVHGSKTPLEFPAKRLLGHPQLKIHFLKK